MAVKIKLQRLGKVRAAEYRVVIADARTRRNGKVIENIGIYHPKEEPSLIQIDSERAQHWLSVGAQPTEPVLALLKVTGDWQKHKGLPGAEGTRRLLRRRSPSWRSSTRHWLRLTTARPSRPSPKRRRRPRKRLRRRLLRKLLLQRLPLLPPAKLTLRPRRRLRKLPRNPQSNLPPLLSAKRF